jgi:hypothetical protein
MDYRFIALYEEEKLTCRRFAQTAYALSELMPNFVGTVGALWRPQLMMMVRCR